MSEQAARVSICEWIGTALTDSDFCGIEFYETTDGPSDAKGLDLLERSCRVRDRIRKEIEISGTNGDTLPYIKFRLASTSGVQPWNASIWHEIYGERACIEISTTGAAFHWGVWESHHETVPIPVEGCDAYTAIFRRCRGFYDGEPWGEYDDELYVFAPLDLCD